MIAAVLCGATGVGKSALALRIAEANGFEIISADSRQFYRDLEIGTNAPTAAEKARVKHHLVGFLDAAESFSPREFPARVHALLADNPGTRFLIVGGSGLYLKALLYPSARDRGPTPESVRADVQRRLQELGPARMLEDLRDLDPEGARALHPNDAYRIAKRWENVLITGESYSGFAGALHLDPRFADVPVLWLNTDREKLYARIDARAQAMLRAGWLDETRRLMQRPDWASLPAATSLGYRELADVLAAGTPSPQALERALEAVRKRTRNYAKRQLTFFRHQLPAAKAWDLDRFGAALEQVGWDWDAFRSRYPEPGP